MNNKKSLGATAVFFTSISAIIGALVFLRFGVAVGTLGFWGMIMIILIGNLIAIPTAFAISELATNMEVEGGGEYFIISRSFGIKIGSTIGITLYLSQIISVALYSIAFSESLEFVLKWIGETYHLFIPKKAISLGIMILLTFAFITTSTQTIVKMLYGINIVLFLSLLALFIGHPIESTESTMAIDNFEFRNMDKFFLIFAIIFPELTGLSAGVGLSGELKRPSRAIPRGIILATSVGAIVYVLVSLKLSLCAPQDLLTGNQLVMSDIAVWGRITIPLGIIVSALTGVIGFVLVAPRTLQALAADKAFPSKKVNIFLSNLKGKKEEPRNALFITIGLISLLITFGDIDTIATCISMFFLITYGTLCLISFLYHFGAHPSYRPKFKSKWYLSLIGFVLSIVVMIMISPVFTILSYIAIGLIYLVIDRNHKEKRGIQSIIKNVLFQINRSIQIYIQKNSVNSSDKEEWRPGAICITRNSFTRPKTMTLMNWIGYRRGFGTYIHLIKGYYGKETCNEARHAMEELLRMEIGQKKSLYIDTIISPSYTSAIAQTIQMPSISGMEYNMVVFEFDKQAKKELYKILENIHLVKSGDFDVCIFASTKRVLEAKKEMHIWIRNSDELNENLMILLGYVISSHPDWEHSRIKIFHISYADTSEETRRRIISRIEEGRLPISDRNIKMISIEKNQTLQETVKTFSNNASLVIVGFHNEHLKMPEFFFSFDEIGDVLFVNASTSKELN